MTTPQGGAGVQLAAAPLPPATAVHLVTPAGGTPFVTTACILWAATMANVTTSAARVSLVSGSHTSSPTVAVGNIPANQTVWFGMGPAGCYCPAGVYAGLFTVTCEIVVYVTPILPG